MNDMYLEGVDVCCGEDKPEDRKDSPGTVGYVLMGLVAAILGYTVWVQRKSTLPDISRMSESEKSRFHGDVLTYL